ncbi:reticulon-1 isoform X2 [Macrosteles quadrilineatus]|uniref:reticulon-1 isoform X2 n=1 Tax=Macrosteles quadrilineatus TaxID=74068 RepID=UPI0023E16C07|nr:reticulon-1 isoform X2 [Macrosteles quadrilineatus]
MDLTYMPGELDMKSAKKSNTDMKRDHDSVDDFEHLDPDLSPSEGHVKTSIDTNTDKKDSNMPVDILEKAHGVDSGLGLPSKSAEFDSGKTTPDLSNVEDSKQIKTEVDFHFDSEGKPSLLDFGIDNENPLSDGEQFDDELNKSFLSSEIAFNNVKTGHDIPNLDILPELSTAEKDDFHLPDYHTTQASDTILPSDLTNPKSMKEDDALPQYDMKFEQRESPEKGDYITKRELELNEPDILKPEIPPHAKIEHFAPSEPEIDLRKNVSEFSNANDFESHEELIKTLVKHVEEPAVPESTIIPTPPESKDNVKSAVKKISVSDLDDIIGPEDVFKRIGLVEALVYWRDPKKSGVVFGGGMAILLSLCFMSLISVIAYTSLLALTGTICFRIYKNILQAVQKTSEGHPFKEFLDIELSLPQDKVREIVDTAVVHVNASVLELRRLFLVEDLIDSIKFGVCLWCLTYVGAIFNGMTLVILAFVALFTVPKIYENNKASIDQYIDMGRSKVAEITSKVKAAVPIGKKEPEKDKEQ